MKHLRDNGRTDDIFSDSAYQQFGQELNKVLKGWQPSVLPDGTAFLFSSIQGSRLSVTLTSVLCI